MHTPPTPQLARLSARTFLGFVGTWVVALMAANLVPVLISRLIADLGLELSAAGTLATGMTVGSVATMLVVNSFIARVDRPTVGRIGLVLMIVGYGIGAALLAPVPVAIGLIVGGCGSGAALAAGTAAFSATENPDRTITVSTVVNRLGAAGLLALAPFLAPDLRSLLILIGSLGVIGLFLAGGLPNLQVAGNTVATRGTITATGVVLAVTIGVWSLSEDMVYSMSSTLAGAAGVGPEATGVLLSLKVAGGLAGVLAAPLMLKTLGRGWSLLAIVVVSTVAKFLMITAASPAAFSVSIVVWGIAYGAVLVLVSGLSALMDVTGRTAVLVSSVYMCGIAFGPIVGGHLLELVSPLAYGLIVAVPSAVFGTALFVIARRNRAVDAPSPTASPESRLAVDVSK